MLYKKIGGSENSQKSLKAMVNNYYHGKNGVINRKVPNMFMHATEYTLIQVGCLLILLSSLRVDFTVLVFSFIRNLPSSLWVGIIVDVLKNLSKQW